MSFDWSKRCLPNLPDGYYEGTFPLSPFAPAPPRGAAVVYLLYNQHLVNPANDDTDMPFYVGSTLDLRTRLKAHARSGKPLVRWWCTPPFPTREAAYAEERWVIRSLGPELVNLAGNDTPRVLKAVSL